ncbi:MAG: amidohydrolase family protein [Gemmatimonadota bacterium]|jgi:N-acyl-D-amino-acid deacylase|nr:amidohydrolase family protein [Gemmatimonadota bacterium]MDQ8147589.1 amidohydrolase family protein [Gemmatimonadota bacterium]MDQ8149481.1 amidohydrolase family protein [Gemmatimonadota bacterium]MDQ8170882.1 amidohydrolase family protein [Gemmatimonadota bacterium]MDQ8177178.1 amidohydrolase family protein [Gemmatimonadota bacterium]
MRRRTFVSTLGGAGVALVGAPALLGARRAPYDLVLRGGVIIDGTGRPRFRGDLAVSGDRIVRVARRIRETGRREIDCRDHIVAPGFVDIHSHGDGAMALDPLMESVARQGITSIVVGADGSSRAPHLADDLESPPTIGAWLASLAVQRPAVNVGTCVGLGTVREVVIGEADRPASDAELARMVALVAQALRDGALGASSGLEYTPGAFASVAELTALCRPLAARGLAYHTHMRNEDDQLLEAIDEAIAIARGAGCGLQIAHLKTQGPRNWGKLDAVFARVAAARAGGVDAAFDRYPYLAYHTGLTNLFPVWSRDGGMAGFFARLADPATAARIRAEALDNAELIGGWDNVQIASVSAVEDKAAEGKRLGAYAAALGVHPYDLSVQMLRRNDGSVGMIGFAMTEPNLERIYAHPQGMVASDGGSYAVSGPARRGVPHPRGAGSFPRVLARYVRERRVLTLEQAIHKMTVLPASRVRLTDRGVLRAGAFADVTVFDPDRVGDRADFGDPFQYPVGFLATLVNGVVAVDGDGRGPRSGRALRG